MSAANIQQRKTVTTSNIVAKDAFCYYIASSCK